MLDLPTQNCRGNMTMKTRSKVRERDTGKTVVQPPRKRQRRDRTNFDDEDSRSDAAWNEAVQRMEVGDINNLGIAIDWTQDTALHVCLGAAAAPIPQRENAAAPIPQRGNATVSGVALQAWFSELVVAADANSPEMLTGGVPSSEMLDHLSIVEYGDITQVPLAPSIMAWRAPLNAADLSAGRFYMVTDAGRGSDHALQRAFVSFL